MSCFLVVVILAYKTYWLLIGSYYGVGAWVDCPQVLVSSTFLFFHFCPSSSSFSYYISMLFWQICLAIQDFVATPVLLLECSSISI